MIENAGTEARRLTRLRITPAGCSDYFVAAEPPVNADVSVAEPESGIGLEGKEEWVKYGREPLSNVIPGEAEDARP